MKLLPFPRDFPRDRRPSVATRRWRGIELAAAPEDHPPFPVAARAYEEDTFLVLSAPTELRSPTEHPVRLFTALWELEPLAPGSVVVGAGRPLRLLAVVHDLGAEPTWREEWVAAAFANLLAEAHRRHLPSLALPQLGTRHGRQPRERCLDLLRRALEEGPREHLRRLWIVAGEEALEAFTHG